ncbi:hypothetical protein QE410_002814 [Microbacterium sp. SORGH_AS 1204]|nr:hypothetical protein [Microbacterium sp. SORGH_AS_1204]
MEGREDDEGEQPGSRADGADGSPEIDHRAALGTSRRTFFDEADRQQVEEGDQGQHDRDREGPPHAQEADRQSAEDARDDEGQALHGADQTVRVRVAFDGNEQGDGGGQGDVAHVLDDRAREDDAGEQPEPRPAQIEQCGLGEGQPQRARHEERGEGDEAGEHHHAVLAVPIDYGAEHHREKGEQQHVGAADDAGREHRARLEVDPEGQREPEEAGRHIGRGGVDEHREEGAVAAGRRGGRPGGGGRGLGVGHGPHARPDLRHRPEPALRRAPEAAPGGTRSPPIAPVEPRGWVGGALRA